MPAVRSGADKWKKRTQAAQGEYAAGVQNPRILPHEAMQAAAGSYAQGVQQAIANNAYQNAATPAVTQKWKQKASTLGAQRFAPGVAASGDAYQQGFAPYHQVIQNTQLPPRGPKGDPANHERSRLMGQALFAAKQQRKGNNG